MQVPYDQLSPEALRGIILEFVSREGTDYGGGEWDIESKIDQVLSAIKKNDVIIEYNHTTQSCNLLTKHQAQLLEEAREAASDDEHD